MAHLGDLLGGDFDGVLLLRAVVQRGAVHVFVVEECKVLHLLPNPCDFILDLKKGIKHDAAMYSVNRGGGCLRQIQPKTRFTLFFPHK